MGTNYVIMDNIEIGKSPSLSNWLTSGKFSYCVCCENIQDILPRNSTGLDSGLAFLRSIADGCQMHVIFKQPIGAAEMWSKYYNEYQKKQIAVHIAKDKGMAVTDGNESIIRPEELSTEMGDANIFVFSTLSGRNEYYKSIIRPKQY